LTLATVDCRGAVAFPSSAALSRDRSYLRNYAETRVRDVRVTPNLPKSVKSCRLYAPGKQTTTLSVHSSSGRTPVTETIVPELDQIAVLEAK
jgi:hypothetical protein